MVTPMAKRRKRSRVSATSHARPLKMRTRTVTHMTTRKTIPTVIRMVTHMAINTATSTTTSPAYISANISLVAEAASERC